MNMKKLLCALVVLIAVPSLAQEAEKEKDVRIFVHRGSPGMPPMPPIPPLPPSIAFSPPDYGIPPHLVEKLGLPKEMVQRVQDLTFEANEALINLEAELKRAQLVLERELRQPAPNESRVMEQVEKVGRAETAVRKNRVGLMMAIKKVVGPDNWQKLEAEMGPFGHPRRVHIERRIESPAPKP
jgi:hypothetical protein